MRLLLISLIQTTRSWGEHGHGFADIINVYLRLVLTPGPVFLWAARFAKAPHLPYRDKAQHLSSDSGWSLVSPPHDIASGGFYKVMRLYPYNLKWAWV